MLVFGWESVYEIRKLISNAESKRNVQAIAAPSTFPKEEGGEKACSARRGTRIVVWYIFLETLTFCYRLHGVPRVIVYDRDPKFIGKF